MLSPKEIKIPGDLGFFGSGWGNSETEIIARNIVMQQNAANSESWTTFTWEDYKAFCTHPVTETEHNVIKALVNGGRPVWNTSAVLTGGDLLETHEGYLVTEKFLVAIPSRFKSA